MSCGGKGCTQVITKKGRLYEFGNDKGNFVRHHLYMAPMQEGPSTISGRLVEQEGEKGLKKAETIKKANSPNPTVGAITLSFQPNTTEQHKYFHRK